MLVLAEMNKLMDVLTVFGPKAATNAPAVFTGTGSVIAADCSGLALCWTAESCIVPTASAPRAKNAKAIRVQTKKRAQVVTPLVVLGT